MKTKLLLGILLFFCFQSKAQTNGWYQYHKATQISSIDVDASGNIHLATDSGYIKYNTTTNMVEDYANLTSQSIPIGKCSSVKVNPTNNNVALGFFSSQGMAIYDGTNYTIYHSGNSGFGDIVSPQFHYTDSGLLYIYNPTDTKYQTFENGVFGVVKDLTFRPQAIIENSVGNKAYFAGLTPGGLADGLYELDKTTGMFTKYTTSNSGIHTNAPTCFFRETNDLLYVGGYMGVSTLDAMGNWATFQEPLPINPSVFYNVFSIDKFSDGTFLVNNSNPNSSEERGFSTVDFSTNTWTHYDSTTYCDNANEVLNMVVANNMVYAHFGSFSFPSLKSRLWSFDTSTNTCEEQDINHLNVGNLNSFGTPLAMRQSSSDTNTLELFFNRNRELKSLDLLINSTFSNGFPNSNTLLTSPKQLNNINPIAIDGEPVLLVGDDDGVWFVDASNASNHIPHNIADFESVFFDIAFSINDGAKSIGTMSGWQDRSSVNAQFQSRIIEVNGTTGTNRGSKRGFTGGSLRASDPIDLGDCNGLFVKPVCTKDIDGSLLCATSCTTPTSEIILTESKYIPEDNTNQNLSNPTVCPPINLNEIDPGLTFAPDPNYNQNQLWFQGTNNGVTYLTAGTGNTCTEEKTVDTFEIEGSPEQIRKPTYSPFQEEEDERDRDIKFEGAFYYAFARAFGTKFQTLIHMVDGRVFPGPASRSTQVPISFEVIPESLIEDLPEDFFIFGSFVYIYNETHYAAVLSTNYGLLFNTSIDYSFLTLSNDEMVLNDNDLVIYPNPANDIISFSDETIKSITVFDINGRKVTENNGNSTSIKTLSEGVYIVKGTTSENISISKKLIKI